MSTTAYLLNPDGTKSTIAIDILGDTTNGYYFKNKYKVPMKLEDDTLIWVESYFKTVASQVIETTDKVFIAENERTALSSLRSALVRQDEAALWLEGVDTVALKYHNAASGITHTVATENWVTNYITNENQLNLVNRLETVEGIFDGVNDADEVINKWHELEDFLNGITENETLTGIISDAITTLKLGNNLWRGSNTFHNDNGPSYIKFESKIETGQPSTLELSYSGGPAATTATVYIPYDNGTIALTKYVPSIQLGASFSGIPKAGDVWIDIS